MFARSLQLSSLRTVRASGVRFNSTGPSPALETAVSVLKKDLKKAMLAKDAIKRDTIKGLMSSIKNKQIDDKNFDEFALFDLYKKSIQQRRDSILEYTKLGRNDLVEREVAELEIIETYMDELPVASDQELTEKINELLSSLADETLSMKDVMKKVDWAKAREEFRASEQSVRATLAKVFRSKQKK